MSMAEIETVVEKINPIPIHVASVAPGVSMGSTGQKPTVERRTVFYTIILTAANDAEQLLPASDDREIAWVQPLDDNVVLSDNMSSAASGTGTVVPKGNNQPYPVQHSGAVYVSAPVMSGATSRITMTAVYCEPNTS
jgi:hypothetical protein